MKDIRFMAKIHKNHSSKSCWEWLGAKDTYGYGRVVRKEFSKTPIKAHRYAFFLYYGHWPEGPCYQACGNKSCVKPNHLFDVSRIAAKEKPDVNVYFEKSTEEIKKRYIKRSRVNGIHALAREYGFSVSIVRQIVENRA